MENLKLEGMICHRYVFTLIIKGIIFLSFPLYAQEADSVQTIGKMDTSDIKIRPHFFFNDPLMIDEEVDEDSHERIFPLWKSIAKGKALPKPWSIGIFQFGQMTNYTLGEANIGLGELPDIPLNVDSTDVNMQISTIGVKVGLWLFPFMNIAANASYTQTDVNIYMENIPLGVEPPNPPTQPLPKVTRGNTLLKLDISGPTLGTSATFAFGWKKIFTTITFSYAYSSMSAANFEAFSDQTIRTHIFLPKLGYSFEGTSVWLGARYMEEEAKHAGSFKDNSLRFDVRIIKNAWSPEVGLNTIMGENWELTLQAGYKPRIFAYFSVGYRL